MTLEPPTTPPGDEFSGTGQVAPSDAKLAEAQKLPDQAILEAIDKARASLAQIESAPRHTPTVGPSWYQFFA